MGTEGYENRAEMPSAPASAVNVMLAQKIAASVTDEVVAFIAWQQSQAELASARERITWLENELRSAEASMEEMRLDAAREGGPPEDEGG